MSKVLARAKLQFMSTHASVGYADKAVLHCVEVANTGDHFTDVAFYRANRVKKSPSERPLSSLSDMMII